MKRGDIRQTRLLLVMLGEDVTDIGWLLLILTCWMGGYLLSLFVRQLLIVEFWFRRWHPEANNIFVVVYFVVLGEGGGGGVSREEHLQDNLFYVFLQEDR